jgi:CheY-like chemotaxis protein
VIEQGVSTEPRRVLIAEDDELCRIAATWLLERRGCCVEAAANGREAVQMSRRNRYNLILMDCQMPEFDGYRATAAIRGLQLIGKRTPIIAMTAHAADDEREACLAAGMDDFIAKPLRAAELEQILARYVSPHPPGGDRPSGASPSGAIDPQAPAAPTRMPRH